jgi:excinuclease ABC subunit C
LFNIQEEVHRFAISFFRNKKSKQFFEDSVLNNIPGLGKKSVEKLLKVYGNVGEIKKATVEELSKYVKKEIAQKILDS